jgi:MFS family permease
MVALLSFCSFLSPVSSTSVLAATPEVAHEFGTDGTVVNVVNAVYMLVMGVSPVVWGPMSQVYGRRRVRFLFLLVYLGGLFCWLGWGCMGGLLGVEGEGVDGSCARRAGEGQKGKVMEKGVEKRGLLETGKRQNTWLT